MKILIANPNMSRTMADLMVAEARESCRPGTEVDGVAADFIAGHALLDSLARHHQGYDAVIVGAFIQSMVASAKELMPIPVIGLAEASLRAAQILGRRVSILGVGTPGRGANQDIISELRMDKDVVSVRPLPLSGTELANDQARADKVVIELGLAAVAEDNADVLVLGGAAFAGMAKRIAGQLPVPVVSPVHYAIGLAELTVQSGWCKPSEGTYSPPDEKPTEGLSPALAAFFKPKA
jgi:Asp/Glu/hydantoin racemase